MKSMATWQCLAGMLLHVSLILFFYNCPSIHSCGGLDSKGQLHEALGQVLLQVRALLLFLSISALKGLSIWAGRRCRRSVALRCSHGRPADSTIAVHLFNLSFICILQLANVSSACVGRLLYSLIVSSTQASMRNKAKTQATMTTSRTWLHKVLFLTV